jgi:hypothetical protein
MSLQRVLVLAGVLAMLAALLAGCGGGAASGLTQAVGTISGTATDNGVLLSTRGDSTLTIGVEGTDIATTALPGERFTLRGVPVGMHTLVVRNANGRRATAVVVGVKAREETNVGDVTLRDAGTVAGVITNAATKDPIPFAAVTLTEQIYTFAPTDTMPHPVRATRTSATGSYMLEGIPVGNYLVSVSKPGYETTSVSVTIVAGNAVAANATLTPTPTGEKGGMKGTVTLLLDDGTSKPLGGVLVRLVPQYSLLDYSERPMPITAVDVSGKEVNLYNDVTATNRTLMAVPEYYTFTVDDGTYALDGVPAGAYTAVAVRAGLEADKKAVTIAAGETLGADFVLKLIAPKVGTVTGVVTNAATGAPIAGAWVRAILGPMAEAGIDPATMSTTRQAASGTAWGGEGNCILPDAVVMFAQTDADGKYQLLVPPTVTALSVYADGFAPAKVPVTVTVGATVDVPVALEAVETKLLTVSGVVYQPAAATKTPVAGATVTAAPISLDGGVVVMNSTVAPTMVVTATTDDAGAYKMALPAGAYVMTANKNYLMSERVIVRVFADTTVSFLVRPGLDDIVSPTLGR